MVLIVKYWLCLLTSNSTYSFNQFSNILTIYFWISILLCWLASSLLSGVWQMVYVLLKAWPQVTSSTNVKHHLHRTIWCQEQPYDLRKVGQSSDWWEQVVFKYHHLLTWAIWILYNTRFLSIETMWHLWKKSISRSCCWKENVGCKSACREFNEVSLRICTTRKLKETGLGTVTIPIPRTQHLWSWTGPARLS